MVTCMPVIRLEKIFYFLIQKFFIKIFLIKDLYELFKKIKKRRDESIF